MAAASATAAPSWLVPLDLSTKGQDAALPQVAVDPQGTATAVWYRHDGSNFIVQSSERPVGGTWSAPVDLSAAGQDAYVPQVAVDPQGTATAVWYRHDGSNFIVQSSERPVGGTWSAPVDLSAAGQDAVEPQVAVDPHGNATAVWRRYDGSRFIVQSSERPVGGAWSAPVDLSAAGQNAANPQVAVDPQGNSVAVWWRSKIVQSSERLVGGAWSAPVDLSAGSSPQVAVDPQGNATVVWRRHDGSNFIVQSSERPVGGAWSAPVDLSAAGQNAANPQVAVDPQGNTTAAWERSNGSNAIAQSSERPAGGAWSAPVDLSAAGQSALKPQVAIDPQGNAKAVWERSNGSNWIVQSSERPVGGPWSAPVDLSAAGQDAERAQVAVDPQGNAVAVWTRFNGSNYIVQAAGYDAAGPLLRGPSTPPIGVAPRMGTAFAARLARVKRGRALLRLRCRGGRCRGVVKLIAPARTRRAVKHKGQRRLARGARRVLIGKSRFAIAAGKLKVIRVRLNRKGRRLLRRARRHRLKVRFNGRGVRSRWVVLKKVRRRRRG